MRRLALVLEYDGTGFAGFQVQPQPERRTVQRVLNEALERLTGGRVRTAGAGRTDTGVHARGQVVAFDAPEGLPVHAFTGGLNSLLPDDVAVVRARAVGATFDPRRDVRDRWYRYVLLRRSARSPLERHRSVSIRPSHDVPAMAAALAHLTGRHDFAAFTTPGADAAGLPHTVRCVRLARLTDTGDHVVLDLVGTAFLPQQVRRTVAALLLVGNRRRPADWFLDLLEHHQRGAAGHAAPPQGLCLMAVRYPPPYDDLVPPLDGPALYGVPPPGYPEGEEHAGDHPEDLYPQSGGPPSDLACD